jgi:hypothetical protein
MLLKVSSHSRTYFHIWRRPKPEATASDEGIPIWELPRIYSASECRRTRRDSRSFNRGGYNQRLVMNSQMWRSCLGGWECSTRLSNENGLEKINWVEAEVEIALGSQIILYPPLGIVHGRYLDSSARYRPIYQDHDLNRLYWHNISGSHWKFVSE